jgi:hypothetical protein
VCNPHRARDTTTLASIRTRAGVGGLDAIGAVVEARADVRTNVSVNVETPEGHYFWLVATRTTEDVTAIRRGPTQHRPERHARAQASVIASATDSPLATVPPAAVRRILRWHAARRPRCAGGHRLELDCTFSP